MVDGALVGRAALLASLDEVVAGAAEGVPVARFFEGPVGVGKSALMEAAVHRAEAMGFAAGLAHATLASRYLPFGMLAGALRAAVGASDEDRRALEDLLAAPAGSGDAADVAAEWRFGVLEGLVELVARTATRHPLLLAFDDLSQGDTGSLAAVDLLLSRVTAVPLVVLATDRTPVASAEVEALVAARSEGTPFERITLPPLDDEASREMARQAVGGEPGPNLLRWIGSAGGNPLLITELVRAAKDEGLVQVADGVADVDGGGAPPRGARAAILHRLGFLEENVLETLRVAAVAGGPVAAETLAAVQGRNAVDVAGDALRAAEAGLLVEDADGLLSFHHDLLREVLYRELPAAARRTMHRALADALADAGEDPLMVAHHLRRGARRGDEAAAGWLRRCAVEHAQRDPVVAADLLAQALELTSMPLEEEAALRTERAAMLVWVDCDEAEAEARRALALSPPASTRARAREVIIRTLFQGARWQRVMPEIDALVADSTTPEQTRLRVLADSVVFRGWAGDMAGAWRQGEEALARAVEVGDDAAAVSAQAGLAGALTARGDLDGAIARGRDALARAHAGSDDARRRHVQIPLALAFQEADRFEEQAVVVADGRSVGERLASYQLPLYQLLDAARIFLSGGNWDDTVAEIEAGLRLAEQTRTTIANPWAYACLALMSLHRGDVEAAAAHADAGQRSFLEAGGGFGAEWVALAAGQMLEATGDAASAFGALSGFWDMAESAHIVFHRRLLAPPLARLARQSNDLPRAEQVAVAVEDLAARNAEVAGLRAVALLCRGIASADQATLAGAVEAATSSRRPLEGATVLETAAGLLTDADLARHARRRASELYEALGATASAARCEDVARPRRGRTAAATGWPSLTPTERRVAALVAEGLSNAAVAERLHVSHHTVEAHLKHMYAKLSIRSRLELARLFDRHAEA